MACGAGPLADLEQLGGQIAATIEKAKADDPHELRKRIAELERQIKNPESRTPAPAKEKPVEMPVLKDSVAIERAWSPAADTFSSRATIFSSRPICADRSPRRRCCSIDATRTGNPARVQDLPWLIMWLDRR
jgi:hypothetical protein